MCLIDGVFDLFWVCFWLLVWECVIEWYDECLIWFSVWLMEMVVWDCVGELCDIGSERVGDVCVWFGCVWEVLWIWLGEVVIERWWMIVLGRCCEVCVFLIDREWYWEMVCVWVYFGVWLIDCVWDRVCMYNYVIDWGFIRGIKVWVICREFIKYVIVNLCFVMFVVDIVWLAVV